jgi:hypothetical protein
VARARLLRSLLTAERFNRLAATQRWRQPADDAKAQRDVSATMSRAPTQLREARTRSTNR